MTTTLLEGSYPLAQRGEARRPVALIAASAAPIVLEDRYRLLVAALVRLHRSRRSQWTVAVGSGAGVIVLGLLGGRHFATSSWPSSGHPALLVAAGLLLLFAQALKAYGWGRLFTAEERPKTLALAAANGGAALIGVVLPGRFDDAMRVAVVRRYRPCPAGVRALCLSLVMLGLIDSVALAPLALAAAVFGGAGNGVRAGLAVVAVGGVAAAALIVALPRLVASRRTLRFRLGRWLSPRTTSLPACVASLVARFHLLGRPGRCALPAPWCARDRLLVPTRAPLSLCRRGCRGTADRSGRRHHANRRRRRGPPRVWRRGLPSTQHRRLRRSPRGSLRSRGPSLRHCLPERPLVHPHSRCRLIRTASAPLRYEEGRPRAGLLAELTA
jgi:hypothetical protein